MARNWYAEGQQSASRGGSDDPDTSNAEDRIAFREGYYTSKGQSDYDNGKYHNPADGKWPMTSELRREIAAEEEAYRRGWDDAKNNDSGK